MSEAPAVEFWHAGLTVADIERSVAFYRDAIGMTAAPVFVHESEAFDRLTDNAGSKLAVTYVEAGAFKLQLVQYLRGGGGPVALSHVNTGSPHLSFYVGDLDAAYRRVAEAGGAMMSEIVANPRAKIRSFYVADPDGVPVELVEKL